MVRASSSGGADDPLPVAPSHAPGDVDGRADPIELFGRWFEEARAAGTTLPEATALATADAEGVPSVRMVLLKAADERGFGFFTNYESRKARELAANPNAALCFHWTELDRQVRVSGTVTRIDAEESRAYFETRPEGSRIGAWASLQSRPLPSRDVLVERFRTFQERYADGRVPLPPHWGGYRLRPSRIEFWQGRPDRLHDRHIFERTDDGWVATRLYP